ncbi:MAG: hypothetical protein ACRD1H_20475 [Vicinamibacterales bacterium]
MMAGTAPPRGSQDSPGRGSFLRVLAGGMLLIVAVAVAVIGFTTLVRVLDQGGYGTPAMRNALMVLGLSGACLAGAIATLIWDVSKRYER